MNQKYQRKWMVSFILLFIFIFLFQGFMIYFIKVPFLLVSLLSLCMVVSIAFFLLRSFTQPLNDLMKILKRLTDDYLKIKAPIDSPRDEFRRLAETLSNMDAQLKDKIEEVSKEKDYLQTILKGMAEGVLVVDENSRIIMVNDALQKLFSLSTEIVDKTPLEFLRNADLETAIQKATRDGKNSSFELVHPFSSDKIFEVNVVSILPSSLEKQKEGNGMRGAIAVFHDISRLKELEKIRQDFVANVSHELRTPLTTIKGYAETLLDGALNEEVAPQFVQVIKRHSDRLEKIVDDLLILSKIESKEFQLNMEFLPVSDLIGNVLDFLKEPLFKKKIAVSVGEIPPTLLVHGDQQYLEQVLINLLDNAMKYGREGGTITISAEERNRKEVEVSIKDDGIGIPKEDLLRVFERFYRVDKGRSRELGGTGLGLSIVKHIVQAHGGSVWAESQIGQGSTFHFTLPKGKD